jgi:hypothetical protein
MEFVNLNSASVYTSYNRKAHRTDAMPLPKRAVICWIDFNITNMNAVVHVKRNAKLYAVGEVVVMIRFCDYLKENYMGHKITVNPDAKW